ncbi:MAG TPA: HipA family kinase [Terriglobales bacterium]|nr:HipA family kinase [Terriglobales bacterium]
MQESNLNPDASEDVGIVQAVQHVKRMRGGAQSHMLRCSDGKFYITKFRNNPQHVKVLANEIIATKLARLIGLTIPRPAIIEVSDWLIRHSPELSILLSGQTISCEAGLQFGSEYAICPTNGRVLDFLPVELLHSVRNLNEFAGIFALDKWLGNADGRQAVFHRKGRERKYTASFIDFGYCFNAGDWNFPDYPLRGTFYRNEVYWNITGFESFEPWLSRLETLDENLIWMTIGGTPPKWYNSEWDALQRLGEEIIDRRSRVRDLITQFCVSVRNPFPRWGLKSEYWVEESQPEVGSVPANAALAMKVAG